jgi:murein DD-endopeptidase MepM/ murein hydrolase activator NlpD
MVGLSGGANGTWGAGWSTGPHLHLSVYDRNGRAMDPRKYFKF